jgi:hypothetical protein
VVLTDKVNVGIQASGAFAPSKAGEIIAWSRILDDEEVLCVVNGNGGQAKDADILVEGSINAGPGTVFEVVANAAQAAAQATGVPFTGTHPVGEQLPVKTRGGIRFVEIRRVAPAEVLVLTNRP